MAKTVKGKVDFGNGLEDHTIHLIERPIAGTYGRVKVNGVWRDVAKFGRWWG